MWLFPCSLLSVYSCFVLNMKNAFGFFRCIVVCFFNKKTAYEMRISDWSSNVCSSDLAVFVADGPGFVDGAVLPPFDNVDVYPLLMELLDVPAQQIGIASCREKVCQYA